MFSWIGAGAGLSLFAAGALGCGNPRGEETPARPITTVRAVVPDAGPRVPAPQHVVGSLRPKLDKTAVYPTRVCVDGIDLIFENNCGCNDALVCHVDRVEAAALHVTLTTDPTRPPMCDDCFAMVPARCAVPPADAPRTIVINQQAAFELSALVDGSCWTVDR